MKKSSKIYIFGPVIILLIIGLISLQLSKVVQTKDFLSEDFYSSGTNLSFERIHNVDFTELSTSIEVQNEMKAFIKGLDLKETKEIFSPLDADYRVVSKSNIEDQLYIFLEENVIVFPRKSSKGYKITNNMDLMKPFSKLREE